MPLDPFAVGVESMGATEGSVNASNEVDLMAGDLFEVQARIHWTLENMHCAG